MSDFSSFLDQALQFSEPQRAELVLHLLRSLDDTDRDCVQDRDDYEKKWAIEIQRRAAAIDAGGMAMVPADEAIERIRQSLANRKRSS